MNRRPFRIAIEQEVLDSIASKLAKATINPNPANAGWERGTNIEYMQELLAYWQTKYDWNKQEAELNKFNHNIIEIDDKQIHFIHEKGKGPNPKPLILTHGWPDSFYRFHKLIELLTNPADGGQSFDVIIPSLPGFGFTDSFPLENAPLVWTKLMTDELGYQSFYAAGGDIGAIITMKLAEQFPGQVKAIHLTEVGNPVGNEAILQTSEVVRNFAIALPVGIMQIGAFLLLQGSKPQTLAFALNDSPLGYAAWVTEKFNDWTDNQGAKENTFTKDELLTHIMIYLVSSTVQSSFHTYYNWTKLNPTIKIEVPTAVAQFPKEPIIAPKEWIESRVNLQRFTVMPSGGHFPAWEEPILYCDDLREFFSQH
jgi:pimeloyl-ACP methyl ester carboxylesterase